MENRTYKNPPINEMYLGVHFQTNPSVGALDLQQFLFEVKKDFKDKQYIFPVIERVGNIDKIPTEPEKVWFYSEDKTKLLQFGRDRMVYNWRAGKAQPISYPKYENIKTDFFKYWDILSNYVRKYKDRTFNVKMCELYYSNILPIGEDQLLKNDADLHKALNFISTYPENYKNVIPHINLEIPIDQDTLSLRLEKIKNNENNSEAFLLIFSMRSKKLDDINKDWYDKANKNIRQLFEETTTEGIRSFWKEKLNDKL